ncbi:tetratricopeptide repeat protein [bacterium]|nr:tetratricopeptide repeat protein [bacterium]
MAYSRLRGARKFKKKEDETTQANLEAQDAFQEQGKKLVDRIMTHPYFVWGTVALIIVIIAASMGISSVVKKGRDADANEYAEAVKIIESKSGESTGYADEAQKMDKALKAFEKVIADQKGSVSAASAMVYAGKAYQAKNDCGKAVDFYKKARDTKKLSADILFLTYEGEAFCKFDKGDYDGAITVWKSWLDVKSPLYKDYALYYIGMSYEKLGKSEEAAVHYKRLQDEQPKSLLIGKIAGKLPAKEAAAKEEPSAK